MGSAPAASGGWRDRGFSTGTRGGHGGGQAGGGFVGDRGGRDWDRGGHGGHHGGHHHHHHGGHFSGGVFIGPVWGPWPYWYDPYPYPYYYAPPPVVIESGPQEYIYQETTPDTASTPSSDSSYWYHCQDPEGYYPYVKECPGGWEKVVPSNPEY